MNGIFQICERNVNGAYAAGRRVLADFGIPMESRAGATLELGLPVVTTLLRPCERVLFNPKRDANPFFHLFEAIWMMAGRDDVAWISQFNSRMKEFSDDGQTFNGAYGHRWRAYWYDQLRFVATLLKEDPSTRRAVLTMWDADSDLLFQDSKDLPCNTQIYFRVRPDGIGSHLTTTVLNRSNDIIWGLYGSNAVHFSVLHEWMAAASQSSAGPMITLSNSFHAYTKVLAELNDEGSHIDRYVGDVPVCSDRLVRDPSEWLTECSTFCDYGEGGTYTEPFFIETAVPMLRAWQAHRRRNAAAERFALDDIGASDWQLACKEWMERRS